MSDMMLIAGLRVPIDGEDEIALSQFVACARRAADRIQADADEIEQLRADALTMALRLYGESEDSLSPECYAVMRRWIPRVEKMLKEAAR